MCFVGGVQAATAAQSRTRIAARPYAMDNATRDGREPRRRLWSTSGSQSLCVLLSEQHAVRMSSVVVDGVQGSLSGRESFQRVFKVQLHCVLQLRVLGAWARGIVR